jgi:hypothetical protein
VNAGTAGLPFSRAAFLDVFAAYNTPFAGVVAALWLVSLGAVVLLVRGRLPRRGAPILLAGLWGWGGIAYHALHFTRINPAAWAFAGLFVVQALLFAAVAIRPGRLEFTWAWDRRHAPAFVLLAYGLAYPFLSMLLVERYPRVPTFGVPCPTLLVTAGFLLTASPVPRRLFPVPILWSLVGGAGAVLLGVPTDFMLYVAGALLVARALRLPAWGTKLADAKRTGGSDFSAPELDARGREEAHRD